MFIFLSKFLPQFIYPAGLTCVLLITALALHRNQKWQTRLTIVALAVLWLGGNRLTTMVLVRSLEWQYVLPPDTYTDVPHADAIVVLGGGSRGQLYPRPTSEVSDAGDRFLYAGWLYQHGAAPVILVSGGSVPWVGPERPSEAQSMVDLLTLVGVPKEAILLEPKARNTYENAVESLKILEEHGIDKIILVTSALHMPRAYAIFAKSDLSIIPAPTDYTFTQADWEFYQQPKLSTQLLNLLPGASNLEVSTRAIKEYIGIVVYRLRGWL